jgi:hypothetical protein
MLSRFNKDSSLLKTNHSRRIQVYFSGSFLAIANLWDDYLPLFHIDQCLFIHYKNATMQVGEKGTLQCPIDSPTWRSGLGNQPSALSIQESCPYGVLSV